MNPEEYFPILFKKDMERYGDGVLCGATLSHLVHEVGDWPHLEHFLLCEYELNLFSQTIHAHFRVDHDHWLAVTHPYIDCRCYHASSGHPISALIHAERSMSEFHLEQKVTKELMLAYDTFFLKYLEDVCTRENFEELTPEKLKQALSNDPDNSKPEVVRYLQSRV